MKIRARARQTEVHSIVVDCVGLCRSLGAFPSIETSFRKGHHKMNRNKTSFLVSVVLATLVASLPSAAWSAVNLESLPFMSPAVGTTINLPLSGEASAVGVVTSTRGSRSIGGQVLYGDLTGAVSGTFTVWTGGLKVESSVDLHSASLETLLSIPADGYRATSNVGMITVTAEALVASDDHLECDWDAGGPGTKSTFGALKSTITQGVVEDQGGAAYPSPRIFYDLLDYAGGSLAVPVLNSYPFIGNQNHSNSLRAVIYLDFNGDDYTKGGDDYSTPAFVTRNDHVLTSGDIIKIEDAFQVVAEMLRPFSVNVTTDLSVYLAAPPNSRSWAFCTADYAGGTAPLSGFGHNAPALVGCRSGLDGRKAGRVAIHEIGHLLNIDHFGPGSGNHLPYYDGHASGHGSGRRWNTPTGWSGENPHKVYQWTRGEFTGATYGGNAGGPAGPPIVPPNYIDSLARIDLELGAVSYRADDRGNTNAQAKTLVAGAEVKGVIEKNTDVDVFKISTFQTGAIVIDVLSLADHHDLVQIDGNTGRASAALDIRAELFNTLGVRVALSDPADELDAVIDLQNMTAGTYYLHVSGTGTGTPTAPSPTGYTSYGSIGSYSVLATYATNPAQQPDLAVTSFSYGSTNTTENGLWWFDITPVATVKNVGTAPAPGSLVKTYLKHNFGAPEPLDVVFNSHDVLEPNAQTTVGMYFPIDLTRLSGGDYRLGAKVDADSEVAESSESNNLVIGSDVTTINPICPVTPLTPSIPPGDPGEGVIIASGQTLNLTASTTDPQGDPILYHWDFNADGVTDAYSGPTASGQTSTLTHTFHSSAGRTVYYVRVRAEAGPVSARDISPWCHDPLNSLTVAVDAP